MPQLRCTTVIDCDASLTSASRYATPMQADKHNVPECRRNVRKFVLCQNCARTSRKGCAVLQKHLRYTCNNNVRRTTCSALSASVPHSPAALAIAYAPHLPCCAGEEVPLKATCGFLCATLPCPSDGEARATLPTQCDPPRMFGEVLLADERVATKAQTLLCGTLQASRALPTQGAPPNKVGEVRLRHECR